MSNKKQFATAAQTERQEDIRTQYCFYVPEEVNLFIMSGNNGMHPFSSIRENNHHENENAVLVGLEKTDSNGNVEHVPYIADNYHSKKNDILPRVIRCNDDGQIVDVPYMLKEGQTVSKQTISDKCHHLTPYFS